MSKVPCSIIRDLLVLYEDDVCSVESRKMIEEHIKDCEECRSIYEKSGQKLPEIYVEEEKGSRILEKAFAKMSRKVTLRSVIAGIIVVLLLFIARQTWELCVKDNLNRVPSEDIEVTELYELSNGDIWCTFEADKEVLHMNADEIKVPEEYREKDYKEGWQELYFQYPHFGDDPQSRDLDAAKKVSVLFPAKGVEKWDGIQEVTHERSAIYYTGTGKDDRKLIWKEGQSIDSASREIEERVREWYQDQNVFEGGAVSSAPSVMREDGSWIQEEGQ